MSAFHNDAEYFLKKYKQGKSIKYLKFLKYLIENEITNTETSIISKSLEIEKKLEIPIRYTEEILPNEEEV